MQANNAEKSQVASAQSAAVVSRSGSVAHIGGPVPTIPSERQQRECPTGDATAEAYRLMDAFVQESLGRVVEDFWKLCLRGDPFLLSNYFNIPQPRIKRIQSLRLEEVIGYLREHASTATLFNWRELFASPTHQKRSGGRRSMEVISAILDTLGSSDCL